MDGAFFYWFCWLIWVAATFLLDNKNKYRYTVSKRLLVIIILSPIHFSVFHFQVYAAVVFIFFSIMMDISRLRNGTILYFFISSFIIMLAYVSFLMFELYDPVWVIINRDWLLAFILIYLTIVLQSDVRMRMYTMLAGIVQGELLYAFVLRQNGLIYPIGSLEFLDLATLAVAILLLWSGLKFTAAYFNTYFNHFEKEKHKSS
ncbi:hypothetical protein PB1_14099 [Bacillus methanolicus PB1]|uniref:Integral inner membrane protein n=1 Tax=Bacillus methanolicus PB1 TaxID=997296 RepID=I3DWS5_BACMT|nr:hypothetical protein [Bacillus methanolicus]EIJ78696.1 hypothetical protein PB1_14099 [Bacillus methanolicus PB1]